MRALLSCRSNLFSDYGLNDPAEPEPEHVKSVTYNPSLFVLSGDTPGG